MTSRQWLIIVALGVADLLVLGCLIGAMVFVPRLMGDRAAPSPVAEASPTAWAPPTDTQEPTWTPTLSPTPLPTRTPFATSTSLPTPTRAVFPTDTPTPTSTPMPILLENAGFEEIFPDVVPGWNVAAVINWQPGDPFDPENSYDLPEFSPADDPLRRISGSTLQIESTHQYVKFQVTIYQIVEIEPGTSVQFEIKAKGFSSEGGIYVSAGIDPNGGEACTEGVWGERLLIDQTMDTVTLRSPEVLAGSGGEVTVCFFAEPQYAVASKAAFFDNAQLIMPPEE